MCSPSSRLAVCLTTGQKPLPRRALHIVRSRTSSFKWKCPLLSLRSSNSFLLLLPWLPVTSIPSCIFPSITRCRRKILRKMWPIQFAFRLRSPTQFYYIKCNQLQEYSSYMFRLSWSHLQAVTWKGFNIQLTTPLNHDIMFYILIY